MSNQFLSTSVDYLKGIGPSRADVLKKELNIFTFHDLITYFPFRYIDRTRFHKISEINSDATYIQLKGKIMSVEQIGKGRAGRLHVSFSDDTGIIELVWFRGIAWIKKKLFPGREYIVFGKPGLFKGRYNIAHPEIDLVIPGSRPEEGKLQAFYNTTEKLKSAGFTMKGFSNVMHNLISQIPGKIPETLPDTLLGELKLMPKELALQAIHFPKDAKQLQSARFRLKFEELFFHQLKFVRRKTYRKRTKTGIVFSKVGDYLNSFYNDKLPFAMTSAQKRVIKEIRRDLGSGFQMNRLLQGDVGSGKTLVALMAMLIALDNGYQACMMAPTEILSVQHYNSLQKFLNGLDINFALLTGSTKTKEKKQIELELTNGSLQILIGTHALIEDNVRFKKLGLAVIDEQHRFGVAQRASLHQKSIVPPHVLVMTATPIPRSMAMTFYGEMDRSVIDELPPGRKAVKTYHYFDSARLKVFAFMKQKIQEGRQIYVVYPLINESDKMDLKDLMDGYESISREFPLPEYAVSMVHGQLKADEKDFEMQRFIRNQTQIMVATTVIEVGVDVPNASVMVIENAERFGLSQLHQLRGRVGRGADQSYCLLLTSYKLTKDARKRIETMVETNDGFKIAEVDLKLRGPGNIEGTEQSGAPDLKIADLLADEKIIYLARNYAERLVENDPGLENPLNKRLRAHLESLESRSGDWSQIL